MRLYSARATDIFRGEAAVIDGLVFGLSWRVIDWARTVAAQAGFVGNWRFGIAVTRIAGARSIRVAEGRFHSGANPFEADDYEAWTEATNAELLNDPDRILERLVGRLNRALSEGASPLPKRA